MRRRQRIMEREGHVCRLCQSAFATEVDHVVPIEDGGTDEADNLQALCHACHAAKTASENKRRTEL